MKARLLREYIVRPALQHLDPEIPYSMEAEDLLVATCCAESQCGDYVRQVGGPAEGIFQMEPATEHDCWESFLTYRGRLGDLIKELTLGQTKVSRMIHSPLYACALARVKYFRDPDPIPSPDDHHGDDYLGALGAYWKRVYNSNLGAGTVTGFVQKVKAYGDFS